MQNERVTWTIPRLKDQASPEQVKAGLRQRPLLKGLQSYGMINIQGNQVSIVPERPVKVDTPLINGFLRDRILEPLQRKHPEITYMFEETNGQLFAILLRGPLQDHQLKELANAARWAFERSLENETE